MTRAAAGWHTRDMVLGCNCFSLRDDQVQASVRSRVPASPFETAAEAGWQPQQ